MHITFFGAVWTIYMLYCLYKNKDRYVVECALFSMIFQASSFIVINGTGIGPQIPSLFFVVFYQIKNYAIKTNHRLKMPKIKNVVLAALPLFFAMAIYISYSLNQDRYINDNIKLYIIQITLYVLCVYFFNKMKVFVEELNAIILKIIGFVLVVGFVQFLGTTIIPHNIVFQLLYTSDTDSAYYWGFYPRVFSTFMEPSYCSVFLVGSFFYLLSQKNIFSMKMIFLSIATLFEIILTFSSTAYATLAIVGCNYMLVSNYKKAFRYLIPLGIMGIGGLFTSGQLNKILNEVIFEKAKSGSGIVRHLWNVYGMKCFHMYPIWGCGYKMFRASSFHISILAQLGIVGTSVFAVWMLFVVFRLHGCRNRYSEAGIFFITSVLISLCISVPDIDNLILWFAIYYSILLIRNGEDNSGANISKCIVHNL